MDEISLQIILLSSYCIVKTYPFRARGIILTSFASMSLLPWMLRHLKSSGEVSRDRK